MRWFEPSLLWPRAALMLLAGALQAASLAWPLIGFEALGLQQGQPVWWLQLLALALLAHRLLDCRLPNGAGDWRGAALWGGLFSTAWLAATFWWMFVAMHTYGGLAAARVVLRPNLRWEASCHASTVKIARLRATTFLRATPLLWSRNTKSASSCPHPTNDSSNPSTHSKSFFQVPRLQLRIPFHEN